jgi:hypothetical protein
MHNKMMPRFYLLHILAGTDEDSAYYVTNQHDVNKEGHKQDMNKNKKIHDSKNYEALRKVTNN